MRRLDPMPRGQPKSCDLSMKKKRMKRILMISGPPGVGKSTVVVNLARELARNGSKVRTTTLNGFHFSSYVLTYALARLRRKKEVFERLIKGRIHPLSLIDGPFLRKNLGLVMTIEFVSIHLAFLVRMLLPLRLGYDVVIVDEGTVNTVANYIAGLGVASEGAGLRELISSVLRLTEKLSQAASLKIFFLDCGEKSLQVRWTTRGYPPDDEPPFTYSSYLRYANLMRDARHLVEEVGINCLNLDAGRDVADVAFHIVNCYD